MAYRTSLSIALGALILALTPALAAAEEPPPDYSDPGFYVAIEGGAAWTTSLEDDLEEISMLPTHVSQSGTVGLRVGYRISRYIAAEFDTEYLTGFDISVAGIGFEKFDGLAFTTNARLYPITGRFQPYAFFGVGLLHAHADRLGAHHDTYFALRAGGGLEAYLTESIFLDAGVVYLAQFGGFSNLALDFVEVRGALGYKF